MKKAFFAALIVAALALLFGATAATSARPSSLQHYMIGFSHSPTGADKALVKSHGGSVRYSFPSIKRARSRSRGQSGQHRQASAQA